MELGKAPFKPKTRYLHGWMRSSPHPTSPSTIPHGTPLVEHTQLQLYTGPASRVLAKTLNRRQATPQMTKLS